jgi:hypothetical protein
MMILVRRLMKGSPRVNEREGVYGAARQELRQARRALLPIHSNIAPIAQATGQTRSESRI